MGGRNLVTQLTTCDADKAQRWRADWSQVKRKIKSLKVNQLTPATQGQVHFTSLPPFYFPTPMAGPHFTSLGYPGARSSRDLQATGWRAPGAPSPRPRPAYKCLRRHRTVRVLF